ncbi:hypothetical protein LAZ67_12001370 [Cordylochernes scorpioides]|uniref:RNA-directed DNA polymerase n=1 Tax=Cordylochernes scorpioides TaxID=51811 RepID=A0ABY6L144_9ARAC|nr:hypothetical protein LAZ67_12001370 [Cordylochernes scorpioides]
MRQEFAAWVFRQIDIDENWLSNVLWTDDAHFSLNGEFNIQNSRIWATENPRIFTEMPLYQPRVTVLCGFTSFIIGPFFFEKSMEELLKPFLAKALSEITFMKDGGPPHISRGAKQLLKNTFVENRVISINYSAFYKLSGASTTKGNDKPREKKLTTNEATRHTLATVILELTAALQGARSTQLEAVFRSATLGTTDTRTADFPFNCADSAKGPDPVQQIFQASHTKPKTPQWRLFETKVGNPPNDTIKLTLDLYLTQDLPCTFLIEPDADHARLRTPLINLLKKDIMWVWDDECQKAFTNLKENLTTHPTLHLYQEGLPCQVYCNTSTFSITGVLKQVYPDGKTYTVQHFSRSLRSHERNYSDLELQCLAIVESVDNFRTYLKDRKFTIFSEHPALQWLKEIKAPSGRLFRWRLRLSRYEYEVRSINGVQQYETGVGTRIPFCGFLDAPLIQSQQSSPPGKSRVTMDHNKLRIVSRKGVLKTIVPSSLTTRLLKSVHTQHHHPNISKMTRLISAQYYWQNMTQDIAKQVKTCPTCRFARKIAHTRTQNKHLQDKNTYDQRHKQPHFEVGDLVLVKLYHHPNTGKLAPYFTGPHTILEIISPNVVRIDRPNQPLQRDTDTIHVNKLKLYTEKIHYISPPAVNTYHIKHNPNYTFPFKHLTPELFPTESLRFKPTSSEPFRHLDPAIFATRRFTSLFPDVKNCKPDNQLNHITPLPKDIKQENCEPTNHSNSTIHKDVSNIRRSYKRQDTQYFLTKSDIPGRPSFIKESRRPIREEPLKLEDINYCANTETKQRCQESKNYRPIAFTSILCKITERIIHFRLIVWLTYNNKINFYQTAYRSQQCTTDQLFYFCQSIIDSFQEKPPKKTTAIFFYMTSAFDRVWREKLREKLHNIGVRGETLTWIADFLRGRRLKVWVNGEFSKEGRTWAGVPQGSVLSPLLNLLYINDIYPYLTEDSKVACYADDIAIWHTSSSIEKS